MARYTNKGLMAYARSMLDYKSPYWYGVKGQIGSESLYEQKRKQFPAQYPPQKWTKDSFVAQYGKKCHDCSGLIEGYLGSKEIDSLGYAVNPLEASRIMPEYDWSANTTIEKCKEKGDISTLPEIEGLILWKDGHVAVYDLGGWCIEERGHSFGTVRTKVSERGFKMWGKHPAIEYESNVKPDPKPASGLTLPELKKGVKCDEVTLFQMCMNDLGYRDASGNLLEIDGSFGGKSESVCIQFERDNYLTANGIVSEAVWAKILHKRFKTYPKK